MHGSHFDQRDVVNLPPASIDVARLDQARRQGRRPVAEEAPVALVFDGTTIAVVMATPTDLADLAVGFALTEGIIRGRTDIRELDIVPGADGIELRIWLAPESGRTLRARQRL